VPDPYWRIGHFERVPPAENVETLRSGRNVLKDPVLAEYYDRLVLIARNPLCDWRRVVTIWNMNLGRYEHLLESTRREVRDALISTFQVSPDDVVAIREFTRRIAADSNNPILWSGARPPR
jgi:hypothetical protein